MTARPASSSTRTSTFCAIRRAQPPRRLQGVRRTARPHRPLLQPGHQPALLSLQVRDGFVDNPGFANLRSVVSNGVHVTWDDHDYLANDPSNPHFMRPEYRAVAIDAITGWDQEYMRYPPGATNGGIERSWERKFNNHGAPFTVRFIILDEETTHHSTLGMRYVRDSTSPTGWKPVRNQGADTTSATLNADPAVVEDWEATARPFFGQVRGLARRATYASLPGGTGEAGTR